jgi:thiol:disulfide interchange protein DsbC
MRNQMHMLVMLSGLLIGTSVAADDVVTRLSAKLRVDPADITPGPMPGLYRVILGPQVAYISADGRYLLQGDIIDLADHSNLTADARNVARLDYIKRIGEQNMIVFAPPHPKHTLTVLTDIDCQYCRMLAHDMPQLNALGVSVQYLPFPRAGVGSPSWGKAEQVWCAKDRQAAYLDAMLRNKVSGARCETNPVAAGYEFARLMDAAGTPVIITEQGRLIEGYVPAEQMVEMLDQDASGTQ